MRWSQLQAELKDRLAPSLRGRLELRQARYRSSNEELGRVWVELDGHQLISFDTARYAARRAELKHDIRSGEGPFAAPAGSGHEGYLAATDAAKESIRRSGEYDDYSALQDLESFLSLSIDDAFRSPSPLVRALAVADRRTGKRRVRLLAASSAMASEHPLVRDVLAARLVADGLRNENGPPPVRA